MGPQCYGTYGRVTTRPDRSKCPGPMKINNSNEWGHLLHSFHDGGCNLATGDGSVRFFSESTALATLAAMATRAGGEIVGN